MYYILLSRTGNRLQTTDQRWSDGVWSVEYGRWAALLLAVDISLHYCPDFYGNSGENVILARVHPYTRTRKTDQAREERHVYLQLTVSRIKTYIADVLDTIIIAMKCHNQKLSWLLSQLSALFLLFWSHSKEKTEVWLVPLHCSSEFYYRLSILASLIFPSPQLKGWELDPSSSPSVRWCLCVVDRLP